jgi:uncharacterized membrane protein HdeD (DUF308 family)
MEAPLSTERRSKPQKVQIIGILMLISGIINICAGLGYIASLAIIFVCCAPIGALPLALGVFEVIYAIRLIGSEQKPVRRQTVQTIAVLEILTILVANPISCIIGIINLILLNDPEVTGYLPE